ncbi:hypothetical protein P4576_00580 [Peribacillus frigoritolerans]|uniref:hypothetical protein n=1 Tax=Peribacillus frigoritolerans TaxID=450367 RepID=UPI002E1B64E7|nr:hypothetical protein [Peribacillus frigoritolerans]
MDFLNPSGQSKGVKMKIKKMVAIVLDRGWLHYWYWIFLGPAIDIKITGPSIFLSFTTAAGILILYDWSFIIISALRILKIKFSCFNSAFSPTLIPFEEI